MSFKQIYRNEAAPQSCHDSIRFYPTAVEILKNLGPLSALLLLVALILLGCEHKLAEPEPPAIIPEITEVNIQANPHNALSAIVYVRARNVATVAVEYGTDSLLQYSTPVFSTTVGAVQFPVLGMQANASYALRVVATSPSGHQSTSAKFAFTTPALPSDFPAFTVLINRSSHNGFVMMGFSTPNNATKSQALIVDNAGRVVWYREFSQSIVDFQKQANGNYTVYSSLQGARSHFYELDGLGDVLREFSASAGRETGVHELRLFEDRYCLYGVEFREMDLSALGGRANASVRGIVIEYHRLNQAPFVWNAFDFLEVDEAMPDIDLQAPQVNPWHSNAFEIDRDGHLLVSFRNSDMIAKINSQTGAIIWRLGGKKNQFTFINDALNGFSHQHGIRRLPNGNIILFDNGNLHSPPVSRVVEYELDESARTAGLVWEYRHEPPLFGFALGFAQRLPNGNTLICYGTAQRIIEVDQARTKVWEAAIEESNRFTYRAFRIDSLY